MSEGVLPFILSVVKILCLLALIRIVQSGLNPNSSLKRRDRAIRIMGGGFLLVLALAGLLLYLKP